MNRAKEGQKDRDDERERTKRGSEKGTKQCRAGLSIDHLDYGRDNCVGVKLQSRTQLVATGVRFSSSPNPPPSCPLPPPPSVPAIRHKGLDA